jgi:transposase
MLYLNNIYSSLDQIDLLFDIVQTHIRNKIDVLIPSDNEKVYYDVTNYYTEIDFNDPNGGLRQRGVSKEHRVYPIVNMSLAFDSNGIPIMANIMPGNTSESTALIENIQKVKKKRNVDKLTVVADKGLNTENNQSELTKMGMSFIDLTVMRVFQYFLRKKGLDLSVERLVADINSLVVDEVEADNTFKFNTLVIF